MTNSNQTALDKIYLSYSEYEVYCLLKKGNSRKETAEILNLSIRTIDTHLGNIYCKGGFRHMNHMLGFDGEIIVGKKFVAKKSEKCKFIEKQILKGIDDKEIAKQLGCRKNAYGMLKKLVINKLETKYDAHIASELSRKQGI